MDAGQYDLRHFAPGHEEDHKRISGVGGQLRFKRNEDGGIGECLRQSVNVRKCGLSE